MVAGAAVALVVADGSGRSCCDDSQTRSQRRDEAVKPHLWKSGGWWFCGERGYYNRSFIGRNPVIAYSYWLAYAER